MKVDNKEYMEVIGYFKDEKKTKATVEKKNDLDKDAFFKTINNSISQSRPIKSNGR